MLATTVDAVISRVRRDAQLTLRPVVATLNASISAGATTFVTSEDVQVGAGSIAALDTELFYIASRSERTFTVIGGYEGTTEAAHTAGTFIEFDPRLPKVTLLAMAEHELNAWGGRLFRVSSTDVAVTNAERTYDLGVNDPVVFLLDVRGRPAGTTLTWNGDAWPKVTARLLRDMPTTDFASGRAIQLPTFPNVSSLHVVYATPFDLNPFELTTDLVEECGLTRGQIDVLEAGLRWRMLSAGLVPRTNWQAAGMSRDSEEVQTSDLARVTALAKELRDTRLANEAMELERQWPTRMS